MGRREELATFRRLREWASARAQPQLAVIQAPPGAGKSALLREAAAAAEREKAVVIEIQPAMLDRAEELHSGVVSQLSLRDRWRELLPALQLGVSLGAEASVSAGAPPRSAIRTLVEGFASVSRRARPTGLPVS